MEEAPNIGNVSRKLSRQESMATGYISRMVRMGNRLDILDGAAPAVIDREWPIKSAVTCVPIGRHPLA